jgi:hypothetical protein
MARKSHLDEVVAKSMSFLYHQKTGGDEHVELSDSLTPMIDESMLKQQEALFWLDEGDTNKAIESYGQLFGTDIGGGGCFRTASRLESASKDEEAKGIRGNSTKAHSLMHEALSVSLVPFIDPDHPLAIHLVKCHGDAVRSEFSGVDFMDEAQQRAMRHRATRLADILVSNPRHRDDEGFIKLVLEFQDANTACMGKLLELTLLA